MATRKATQENGEATHQPPCRVTTTGREPTLFDIFNEAMKEPPRDVTEDFSKGGRTMERHAGNKVTSEEQHQEQPKQKDGEWQTATPRWKKRIPMAPKVK